MEAQGRGVDRGTIDAEVGGRGGARLETAGEDLEQRGLAGTAGADDGEQLAGAGPTADVAEYEATPAIAAHRRRCRVRVQQGRRRRRGENVNVVYLAWSSARFSGKLTAAVIGLDGFFIIFFFSLSYFFPALFRCSIAGGGGSCSVHHNLLLLATILSGSTCNIT